MGRLANFSVQLVKSVVVSAIGILIVVIFWAIASGTFIAGLSLLAHYVLPQEIQHHDDQACDVCGKEAMYGLSDLRGNSTGEFCLFHTVLYTAAAPLRNERIENIPLEIQLLTRHIFILPGALATVFYYATRRRSTVSLHVGSVIDLVNLPVAIFSSRTNIAISMSIVFLIMLVLGLSVSTIFMMQVIDHLQPHGSETCNVAITAHRQSDGSIKIVNAGATGDRPLDPQQPFIITIDGMNVTREGPTKELDVTIFPLAGLSAEENSSVTISGDRILDARCHVVVCVLYSDGVEQVVYDSFV